MSAFWVTEDGRIEVEVLTHQSDDAVKVSSQETAYERGERREIE